MDTLIIAIILIPLVAMLFRHVIAMPLERFIKRHAPEKVAKFLTKEYGDDRDYLKDKEDGP